MKIFSSGTILTLAFATPLATACTGGPTTDAGPDASDVARDTPISNEASVDATDAPTDSTPDAEPDAPVDVPDAGPGMLTVTSSGALVSTWVCGDPFPTGGDVTLRNEGGSPLAYHSALDGPYATTFATTGPANGMLAPGATATIHVAPVRWIFDTSSLATRTAVFHVYADNGAIGGGDVPVEIAPHGAILVADPLDANVGDVRVGSNAMVGIATSNLGDRDASLTFGTLNDPQFTWPVAAGMYTLAAHDNRFDITTFTPTGAGPAVAMLPVSATGPICYSNISTRTFRGNGTTGNISVSGDIDFGNTLCGGTATPRTITLTNTGPVGANFTASLASGGTTRYRLSATAGTVNPGMPVTLTVTPEALPNTVPSLPGDFGDIVVIDTDVPGDAPHLVHLTQGARGAILAWDRSSVNLAAAVGQTATASLVLRNTGSEPATVHLATSLSETSVVPTDPTVVPAFGSIAANVSFTATSATQSLRSAVFTMPGIEGLCQVPPARVVVDARGSSGELLLDRDAIDFGAVACGASASDRTLVITNPTPSTVNFTARVGLASSPFSVSLGSGTASDSVDSSIPAGGSIALTVHGPAIPATPAGTAAMNDFLVISSNAPSDTGHVVQLHLQPTGAIVAVDATSPMDFGTIPTGTSVSRTIAFTNTGSVPVDVRLTVGTDFYWSRDLLTLPADGTPVYSTLTGFARTNGTTSANFDLAIVGGTPTCAAVPATYMVSVTGAAGVVSLSHNLVDFRYTYCRQGAPPPRSVTISNEGTVPYTFNATAEGPYTVSPLTGTLAPGEMTSLTLGAQPVTDGVPGQRRGGVVAITTDIPGDTVHFVQLRDQIWGALLTLPPTTLDFGGVRVGGWAERNILRNSGNMDAVINIAGSAGTSSPFSADWGAPGGDADMRAFVTPTAEGVISEDWTLTVAPGTALCAPFAPAPMHITATGAERRLYPFPTSIDLGGAPCDGSAVPTRTIELRNPTPIPVSFSSYWDQGANAWATVSPDSGTVPANGSLTLTITPRPITTEDAALARDSWSGRLDQSLRVDYGAGVFTIPVHEHAVGAIYRFSHIRPDYNLSLSGRWADFASIETTGTCGYGRCSQRWILGLMGLYSAATFNLRDVSIGFRSPAVVGDTITASAIDLSAGGAGPICHAPPATLATWTAIP